MAQKIQTLQSNLTQDSTSRQLRIQDILRSQSVKRWTIVETMRPQNLAEHTFNVVAIARAMAKIIGVDDTNIMKYAFDHDLDEILTGDIPTPAKDMMGTADQYEGKSKDECGTTEIAIVRLADIIEAIWYINIFGLGRHAVQVCDYLIDKLNQRVALYSSADPRIEKAVGQVVADINDGKFTL